MAIERYQLYGCDIKSVSCNVSIEESPNLSRQGSYSIALQSDPEVPRQFSRVSNLLGNDVNFYVGDLQVSGQIIAADEVLVSAGGTGIINLKVKEGITTGFVATSGRSPALTVDELLFVHAGEIISRKSGYEIREQPRSTLEIIVSEILNQASVHETLTLEAAGLPKSNTPELIVPTDDQIFQSLGYRRAEVLALEIELLTIADPFQSFDQIEDILEPGWAKITYINSFQAKSGNSEAQNSRVEELKNELLSIYQQFYDVYSSWPRRATVGVRAGEGPEQINVQLSPNGITTSYVYSKAPSQLDLEIQGLRSSVQDGLQTLGTLELDRWKWDIEKPTGGLGVIVAHVGGPFYQIRRLNNVDLDPQTFSRFGPGMFVSEWPRVRNLAEQEASPGYLSPGTRVTVSIFKERESSFGVPYIEQSPQVFAPPIG